MEHHRLTLEKPSMTYQEAYCEFIREYRTSGEKLIPWVIKLDPDPFDLFLKKLQDFEKGIGLKPGYVSSSTFWLVEYERKIIGVVNIRHALTEKSRQIGGHIGYGIRPSERNKGYGTIILKLALEQAKKLEIHNVLLTCDKDNIPSARVMIKNGAVLDSEVTIYHRTVQRYWIRLEPISGL